MNTSEDKSRMMHKIFKGHGFTLLELMVVVMIIGILAAVAIPMVGKYLLKSKTTEASLNLRKIYDGEVAYFQEERTNQAGTVVPARFVAISRTPTTLGVDKRFGDFNTEEWALIKFSPDGPVLYSYSVDASGVNTNAAFTARAEGDIDGDGRSSLFERVASVNSLTGEVEGGGALFILDELE